MRLSDPGVTATHDPSMLEYLRSYGLPAPPAARYGYARLPSPQANHRVSLFGQAWVPSHAIGTIVLFHGYAEHSANYSRLVQEFVENQFAVITMDLRGHGLSEGPIGHCESSATYAEDIEFFLSEVFPLVLPNRPLYIWGHSLGAMVGLQTLLRGKLPVKPAAAVFTSPLLGFPELKGAQKILAKIAPLMATLLPNLPVSHGIPPETLCRDEEYLARRFDDPLIGKVTTPRWFASVKSAVADLQANAARFAELSPTLLLLAGNEQVTNLSDARQFAFRAYAGMNHKVIEFPGMCHELEKEPDVRARIVAESIAWLRSHPNT
jgi:alpha-beta hydrolase superfamily lysophospholipase